VSAAKDREASELIRAPNVLLSGVYAWAVTVLYPSLGRGPGLLPRISCGVALACLIAGVVVGSRRSSALGRLVGLHGFVGFSLITWVLLGSFVAIDRLEPLRAALGGVGWVLFAFGWGSTREPASIPEDDPRALPGEPLTPRGRLPRGAGVVLTVATVLAAVPLALAWRVARTPHALLAHAVAIAAAIAVVSSGAEIAVRRGRWSRVEPPGQRFGQAAVPLAMLAIALCAGAIQFLAS
jgi:hypothetical protein